MKRDSLSAGVEYSVQGGRPMNILHGTPENYGIAHTDDLKNGLIVHTKVLKSSYRMFPNDDDSRQFRRFQAEQLGVTGIWVEHHKHCNQRRPMSHKQSTPTAKTEIPRTDNEISDTVIELFEKNVIRTMEGREPAYEWIDLESLERLIDSAEQEYSFNFILWGYHVEVTPEMILIYDKEGLSPDELSDCRVKQD
jgi:hypothetical protein